MNARRIAGSLVFAAAALASVATSAPPPETVEGFGTIESTEVLSGPATAFGITAEARSRVGEHDGGDVDVSVQVRRLGDIDAAVRVRLVSETDPSVDELRFAGDNETVTFSVPAWQRCQTDPCFEDYRLEIKSELPGSSVIIDGNIIATLQTRSSQSVQDSQVIVQVVPLGIVE